MSRTALVATAAVLGVEAAALVFGGRWSVATVLLLSCAAAAAAPAMNAGPLASLLGRILLVLTAAVMAFPAASAVGQMVAS
jgi:hypothetical protein